MKYVKKKLSELKPYENNPRINDEELIGTTEFDAEVFGDEEFKYECPNCGFRFN